MGDHLDHPFVECAPPLGVRDLAVAVGVEALDVRVDELLPRRLLLQRKGEWEDRVGGWGDGSERAGRERGIITCSGVASSLLVMFIDAAISSKSRKPVGDTHLGTDA